MGTTMRMPRNGKKSNTILPDPNKIVNLNLKFLDNKF